MSAGMHVLFVVVMHHTFFLYKVKNTGKCAFDQMSNAITHFISRNNPFYLSMQTGRLQKLVKCVFG